MNPLSFPDWRRTEREHGRRWPVEEPMSQSALSSDPRPELRSGPCRYSRLASAPDPGRCCKSVAQLIARWAPSLGRTRMRP